MKWAGIGQVVSVALGHQKFGAWFPSLPYFPPRPQPAPRGSTAVFFLVPVDTANVYGDVPPVIFRGGRIGVYTSLFYWSKYIVILLDVLFVFMIGRYYVFLYWQYNASIFRCH